MSDEKYLVRVYNTLNELQFGRTHFTEEPPWWEITPEGRLDIFVGDMVTVATYVPGSFIGVSPESYIDDPSDD